MSFYSALCLPPVKGQTFDKIVPKYGMIMDKETHQLKPGIVGERNIYAQMQANCEGTTIYDMIERYQQNDLSLESLKELISSVTGKSSQIGVYADLTVFPQDQFELEEFMISAEQTFYRLPPQVRAEFGNNYHTFAHAVQDGTYESLFQAAIDKQKKRFGQEPETKEPESKQPESGKVVEVEKK